MYDYMISAEQVVELVRYTFGEFSSSAHFLDESLKTQEQRIRIERNTAVRTAWETKAGEDRAQDKE